MLKASNYRQLDTWLLNDDPQTAFSLRRLPEIICYCCNTFKSLIFLGRRGTRSSLPRAVLRPRRRARGQGALQVRDGA
jgi:hypothetical protein